MIKKICIAILVLLCSCKQNKTEEKETSQNNSTSKIDTLKSNDASNYKSYPNLNWLKNISKDSIAENYWKEIIQRDSIYRKFKANFTNSFPLKNKRVIFLYRAGNHKYLINEEYCKTISEPERAVLGYLAINYGTLDVYFDKNLKDDCTMRTALNLDYQYSENYKNFLQFSFRNDSTCLERINDDTTIYMHPQFMGSSVYFFFTRISLVVKENYIFIYFSAEGFNRDIWELNWTGKMIFLVNDRSVKLISKKESKEEFVYYYPNGSGIDPQKGYVNNGKGEYRLPKKSKKKIKLTFSSQ